ncbi:MAG TPA: sensor histidine kinase [Usitatibacter sp.]|nr:sensor histidine kinase [Usitatibacter sp.]
MSSPITSSPPASPPAAALAGQLSQLGRELESAVESLRRNPASSALDGEIDLLSDLVSRLRALAQEDMEREVARRTQELASLSAFLQTNAEREKAALARELHDELGGILTPAKMDLAWLQARLGTQPEFSERMARLGKLIDQGIDLKRRIIERLRPSLLDHLGLAAALEWYVEEACRNANIEPHLHVARTMERLTPDLEIALYRLVQEAVTNVVRHARAAHLDLTLERTPQGVHMTVSDDGVGIGNVEAARKLSHGIAGMSHRIRSMSGTLHVHSPSGQGTRVEIFVPLARP